LKLKLSTSGTLC